MTTVETKPISVTITPEIMAKAFWAMTATEQGKFFDALAGVIEQDYATDKSLYSHGEMQWLHLKNRLRQPGMERANQMHMALSAFAFDFWERKPSGAREGL